jgi:hypothetical protein
MGKPTSSVGVIALKKIWKSIKNSAIMLSLTFVFARWGIGMGTKDAD